MRTILTTLAVLLLGVSLARGEPPRGEQPAPAARYLVQFDAYFLRMPDRTARALLGRCAPGGEGRVALLSDVGHARLLAAVEGGRIEQVTSPRITLYDRQRGNVSVLNRMSYLKDVEMQGEGEARAPTPVVDAVNDGIVVDVRPFVGADGRMVTLDLALSTSVLKRPMTRIPLKVGGRSFEIQVPELTTWSARRVVRLRPGTHGLFKGHGDTWVLVSAKALPAGALGDDFAGAEIDLVPSNFRPPKPPGR